MAGTKPEDVLFDQLEFLLSERVKHLTFKRECTCDECLRFSRVYEVLMEPFGEKTQAAAGPHQSKTKKAAG